MSDSSSDSTVTEMRGRGKWFTTHAGRVLVGGGLMAGIIVFVIGKLWEGGPDLTCVTFPPLRHPDGMSVQVLVFKNVGRKPAEATAIKIQHPQVSSLDFQIEAARKAASTSRTTNELFVTFESIAPKETVKIILKVASSAPPIAKEAIQAVYKDGAMDEESVVIKRWEKIK